MSNPVIIETDLKDILDRIDKRLDRIEQKFETRIDRMEQKFETRLDGMEQKFETRLDGIDQKLEILPRIEAEIAQLKVDVIDLKGSQRSQIWVLIVTVVGAIIKFGFFPNP
jgi:DNA anti-recombination protein RmuC